MLTRGESVGRCSFICVDEVDMVFFVCVFSHMLGVYRIRGRGISEGDESVSERKKGKKGKKF